MAWFERDISHKYHLWYFKIVSYFSSLTAREIMYNNFEISFVVLTPNTTTNHAISYTNKGFWRESCVCNNLHISHFYVLSNLQNLASSIVHSLRISAPASFIVSYRTKGSQCQKGYPLEGPEHLESHVLSPGTSLYSFSSWVPPLLLHPHETSDGLLVLRSAYFS